MLENRLIIERLQVQLEELKSFSSESSFSVEEEIRSLENKIAKMKLDMWTHLDPWDRVQLARRSTRLTALDYIEEIFDDFTELHGDRLFGDDPAVVGGVAFYQGTPVTVIGQQKGRNTKDNITRNFAMPNPEGYRKSLRLMKQAEKFSRPVICFIDTPGAYCGLGAEERGQGEAIARNLMEMSAMRVPILSIVIGEGGSGGALALAVGNQVWMLENSIYSILSPEGFATILWKDSKKAEKASEIMKITAADLLKLGIIDKVIEEPLGGMDEDPGFVVNGLQEAIGVFLTDMKRYSEEEIIEQRYQKFRKFY